MLLETKDLTVRFGVVTALSGLDMTVDRGEVVGLIGPNGAGKTTSIDAITGFVPATGEVLLDGVDISTHPAFKRVNAGVVRTFQQLELYYDLTVRDNLLVSAKGTRHARRDRVEALMREFEIIEYADVMPDDLSHGRQKMVSIARALASEPQLVLLDEPAAGLDSQESLALAGPIRELARQDMGVLLIDHDVDLVLAVCDRVYVLDFGKLIHVGPPASVRESEAVRTSYLGVPA
jgi:branched-chain amino acid transport system ATP-binding protein